MNSFFMPSTLFFVITMPTLIFLLENRSTSLDGIFIGPGEIELVRILLDPSISGTSPAGLSGQTPVPRRKPQQQTAEKHAPRRQSLFQLHEFTSWSEIYSSLDFVRVNENQVSLVLI